MAVQFITGSSGSGKTFVLYQQIIEESMQHPEGRYYVIVPEQFTMSTQKRLVMLHPRHAIMNIDILSFNRLAYRVFEELGYNTKSVLDDTGKNLVLRRIASLQEDHLSILKNKMKRPGYVDQVKSFISELEQYHILPEDLIAMGDTAGMPPLFSQKTKEISLLYKSFLDYIRSDYITAEQVLSLLMEVIDKSEKVKDSVMVFDGFTGFTPLQNEVIQRLMPMTKKMVFTVTIDEKEPLLGVYAESDLFAMSKKMTAKLTDMAHMTHTEILEPLRLSMGEHSRFSSAKALDFMEAHLFRNDKEEFLEPDREEVAVYRLNDPREELAFCANRIRALCAKEGYRYGDMAIVCGDLNTYKNYFEEVFLQYDIPIFTDASLELSYQPAIEFIFSFLDVLSRNFSYESMLHFLRTGLTGLTTEQVDLFDSYLYRSGIRGFEKYAHIFTVRPSEFEEEELSQINEIRSMLYEAFAPVTDIFKKDSTVLEKSEGLLRIMEHFSVEEKCAHAAEEYIENKEQVKAQEYGQIYGMITDLLDKMGSILGEERVSVKEYTDLLRSAVEAAKIGVIPPMVDGVVIGDIERTRLEDIKVLFFIGVMDGAIPKSGNDAGILSQNERNILAESGFELAPTQRQRSFMQRFYLYRILTKASEKVYITYPSLDGEGSTAKRSYLISVILKMFPALKVQTYMKKENPLVWMSTRRECKDTLILLLRQLADYGSLEEEKAAALHSLLSYYGKHHKEEGEKILEGVFFNHETDVIARSVMSAINGGDIRISVSRLEQYATCAYRYFLQYALSLQEKRTNAFQSYDIGNLYHEALERFSQKIKDSGESWFSVTDEKTTLLLDEAIRETMEQMKQTQVFDSARDSFVLMMMKNTLKRTVWALMKQVRAGKFEPKGFEVQLSEISSLSSLTYELSDHSRLSLNGVIDRLDTYETEDKVYVKILDYKSGNKDLDLLSLYYGLQIQLVFYAGAAVEGLQQSTDKEVLPGAMMYYHIDDPLVESSSEDGDIADRILRSLKPKGEIFAADEVIEAMDGDFAKGEIVASDVFDMKMNKDGSLSKTSRVMSGEDISTMISFVKHKVHVLGEAMASGQIAVDPYAMGDKNGCTYCSYRSVCGFDPGLDGYDYRKLKKIPKEDLLAKMKEEEDA